MTVGIQEQATGIAALADELGISCVTRKSLEPGVMHLDLQGPRGLTAVVVLSATSMTKGYRVGWRIDRGDARLSYRFASEVNRRHWQQASDGVAGFEALLSLLRKRFTSAIDGSAFRAR